MMAEAEEVTVIVHGARGLQGRKSGRHKFSVIFGVGAKKYRTDIVKDATGCPDFNEESVISVQSRDDNVFFMVTEKDDILGQITIPVISLQSIKGRVLRCQLGPHKKCPKPKGDLIYQCYISKFRSSSRQDPVIRVGLSTPDLSSNQQKSGLFKFKHSLASTPILPRRFRKNKLDTSYDNSSKRKPHTLVSLNKRFSQSLHDLLGLNRGGHDTSFDKGDNTGQNGVSNYKAVSINFIDELGKAPVVISINPKESPTAGCKQLVIIGQHLGTELTDITEFSICGCDLLDSLQYDSSMRLYCMTSPWMEGSGDLIIETTSGGRTKATNAFTFTDKRMSSANLQRSMTEDLVLESIDRPKATTLPNMNNSNSGGDEDEGTVFADGQKGVFNRFKSPNSPEKKNKYTNKQESRHIRRASESVALNHITDKRGSPDVMTDKRVVFTFVDDDNDCSDEEDPTCNIEEVTLPAPLDCLERSKSYGLLSHAGCSPGFSNSSAKQASVPSKLDRLPELMGSSRDEEAEDTFDAKSLPRSFEKVSSPRLRGRSKSFGIIPLAGWLPWSNKGSDKQEPEPEPELPTIEQRPVSILEWSDGEDDDTFDENSLTSNVARVPSKQLQQRARSKSHGVIPLSGWKQWLNKGSEKQEPELRNTERLPAALLGWTKADLVVEVEKLEEEVSTLRRENADMKGYIDKLVAKVIANCPNALEAEDL